MSLDTRCKGPDSLHLAAGQIEEQQLRHWITAECEWAGSSNTSFLLGMNRVRLQSATVKHCRLVITLIYRGEIEILVCPRLHLFHCLLK